MSRPAQSRLMPLHISNTNMMRLKRSKTSLGDLARLDTTPGGEEYSAPAHTEKALSTRPKRGFSMAELTSRVGLARTPRKTIDKAAISRPILDPCHPIIVPSTTTVLGEVSPQQSVNVTPTNSNASKNVLAGTCSVDTTDNQTGTLPNPGIDTQSPYPQRLDLCPAAIDLCSQPRIEANNPLVGISESSFELEHVGKKIKRTSITDTESMEHSRLQPPGVGTKARAIQQAKEMQDLVAERAKRSGDETPPYDFYELIGKGAYGRVFKGKNRNTGGLVAIKIIDIDKVDYEEMTTKNLSETLKEINILQQLRDSKARPYVNIIEEARPVHNELWIISEYASGGSVNTLMKPTMNLKDPGPGLPEKFIIPIARELALGLKYIHEAGVLHRDLKCNNILILEDGRVQLCDFGVSGTLEPEIAKRSTIVGTPYWMAPELQKEWIKDAHPQSRIRPNEILYGSEVDIWAYGCTVYEMATGFPPFHKTIQWDLPDSGVPVLEGERHSEILKDFVSFILQPNPQDRPTPDQILEHPFIVESTKMFPTVILVKLVEDYYKWEHEGGARASLFNPYGAQAPDPLIPEIEGEDDDWTFSTSDEFENRLSRAFPDPFTAPGQPFAGMSLPPDDEDRFAKLQASIREEQIDRGGKRLNRLFDMDKTPYRYSGIDGGSGRPPSDLILRDFNPGAPNRETVIDLDFAAPTASDVPSIDLGEVPTLKANRMQKLLREMQMEDEESDRFEENDQTTKRATRDWKFPSANEQSNRRTQDWKFPSTSDQPHRRTQDWKFPSMAEESNRQTQDWKFPPTQEESNRQTRDFRFPAAPSKPNRTTREWTFDAAMAEANYQNQRNSRRETKDWTFPSTTEPSINNRKTRDFIFPMRGPVEAEPNPSQAFASSPTLESNFRPSLRHATKEPLSSFDDYPHVNSAPESPLRTSVIDLDMAMVDDYRPGTSGSASTTTHSAATEQMHDNPFNLEDQVHLSQNNNRTSYHTKSQSEPNHAIPGLLTPQSHDDQGIPTNIDPHHPSMHARGVSSVSQMQAQFKPPSNQISSTYHRASQRPQQIAGDGWSHSSAYGLGSDDSPPMSVTTDTSADDEDIDEAWDTFEKITVAQNRYPRSRHNDSRDEHPTSSDVEDGYSADVSYDELPHPIRVSVGPNGKPLVDFPIPNGPDPESLLGIDADPLMLQDALWKSTLELRDGLRGSRDLLKAMRLEDVKPMEEFPEEKEVEVDGQSTVRVNKQ